MRRLGVERVVGPDQLYHRAQRDIGRQQGAFLTRQQFEAEQSGLGRKRSVDVGHRSYPAAAGAAACCNSAIISSVERTSANMIIRIANVALCSSSVRQAFASET